MDFGVISVRYARALLKSAIDQKLDDQVYHEMQTLAKSYIDVPALRQTIDNPMLSKDVKQILLTTAAGPLASQLHTVVHSTSAEGRPREHDSVYGQLVRHALP